MQGSWILKEVHSKAEVEGGNAGDKFWFEEESQRLLFGALQSARHREKHGKLVLRAGKDVVFDGQGKLIQTDKHPKDKGKSGLSKYQFVPAVRLDNKEFSKLRGHIEVTLEAEFWHVLQEGEQSSEAPAPLEADDNVVPNSTAADMKANVRKKLAKVS